MVNLRFTRMTDRYLGITLCHLLYFLNRVTGSICRKRENKKVDKILMIKTWGIGNLIMMFPTIRAIRQRYPQAQIDMLTLFQNKELLRHNPFIDNVYFLSNENFLRFAVNYLRDVFKIRRERYDMVLDFEQFARVSSVLALLSGAGERIGFDTPGQGRGIAYTKRVAYLDYTHMVETFFRIAKGAGIEEANLSPLRLDITEREKENVKLFLKDNGAGEEDIVVGAHIGSSDNMMAQRRWATEKFARLADALVDKHKVKIVFTGAGKDEAMLIEQTISLMENSAINAVNVFTLKELAALTERCALFISNDTAPVHIASAMGTPVVAFYGPNTPYLYGPRGKNDLVFYKDPYCSPCITNYNAKISKCDNPICTKSITVEEVLEGIEKKYFKENEKKI